MLRVLLLCLMVFPVLFSVSAYAQEEEIAEDASVTYAPDFCDFSVVFPGEPYNSRACLGDDNTQCSDLVSYTQVYDMASTVNFRVLCKPISAEVSQAYDENVMAMTLRGLAKSSMARDFNISYREEETYKQAGIAGEGLSGRTPTIYIAQLWVGKGSVFSLEAELIGSAAEDADIAYRDVLRSVGLKATDDADEIKPTEP